VHFAQVLETVLSRVTPMPSSFSVFPSFFLLCLSPLFSLDYLLPHMNIFAAPFGVRNRSQTSLANRDRVTSLIFSPSPLSFFFFLDRVVAS